MALSETKMEDLRWDAELEMAAEAAEAEAEAAGDYDPDDYREWERAVSGR
jgi:hypothetical protein